MSQCDECRRGFVRAAITGVTLLFVPGCGGASSRHSEPDDGEAPSEGGEGGDAAPGDDGGKEAASEAAACQPTCAAGTKTVDFPFSVYPQLQNVGGSALNSAPGYSDPSCHVDTIIVAQPSAGTYVAFSAGCPHECCVVSWNETHSEFVCPCHGSTFDISGQVSGGPAPNGLQQLSVCADDCGVYVSLP
jgi:Rieske Fe-S protein